MKEMGGDTWRGDKTKGQPPEEYIQRVLEYAVRVWSGEMSELRLISNRGGVSVLPTEREYFGVENKPS